jgi:hypothetical protein
MSNEFISAATNTLKEVAKTMLERGDQYADTWGKDGCWHLTKAIIKEQTGTDIDEEACKRIALATFIDQKYSRFAGSYRTDTAIDMINYLAALVDMQKQASK